MIIEDAQNSQKKLDRIVFKLQDVKDDIEFFETGMVNIRRMVDGHKLPRARKRQAEKDFDEYYIKLAKLYNRKHKIVRDIERAKYFIKKEKGEIAMEEKFFYPNEPIDIDHIDVRVNFDLEPIVVKFDEEGKLKELTIKSLGKEIFLDAIDQETVDELENFYQEHGHIDE